VTLRNVPGLHVPFFRVVDRAAFRAISSARRPVVPDLQHTEWLTARNEFATLLRRFGTEDGGSGHAGDFILDLDWYGIRAFNVGLLTKQVYRLDLFAETSHYLGQLHPAYVVSVVGDFPRNPILFTALITATDAHFTYGIGGMQHYEDMAETDDTAREWLRVLQQLTG